MAQNRKPHHHPKNPEQEDGGHVLSIATRTNVKSSLLLLFLLLISCALLASVFSSASFSPSYLLNSLLGRPDVAGSANSNDQAELINAHKVGPCSSPLPAGAICCDRSDYHSDVCFMSGDVRMHSPSSSIFVRSPSVNNGSGPAPALDQEEKIKPYTRKWEAALAGRIPELRLRRDANGSSPRCDVRHDAPALVFFAGGYTGNLFHAFNDGIVPLYITSHLLRRRVVLVVVHYQRWWHSKYSEILSQLSAYPPVDFNDTRTHCFPSAVVGLRFHGTFAVDPTRLHLNTTISDFQQMLAEAYGARSGSGHRNQTRRRPKLVIISRTGTRRIENEAEVVQIGKGVGFDVEVLRPADSMAMSRIYESLSSCDVMMGVHGAALTHFLFLRPGAAFVQIVPLGLDKYAHGCFGEAAATAEMRLHYEEYKVLPRESSLYRKYGAQDPVVTDPESVKAKGWQTTKDVYLDGQDLRLDGRRVHEMLARVFRYVVSQRAPAGNGL